MATIRDVARAAGVSIATVSAVTNGSAFVSPTLAGRVRAAIAATGYRPDGPARALRAGTGKVLGLVVPDLANPATAALAQAIAAAAGTRDHALLLEISDDDPRREAQCLERLRAQRVAGILLVAAGAGPAYAAQLRELLSMPTVQVERTVEGLEGDVAAVDQQSAAARATAHLLGLGHRRVALIAGPAAAAAVAAQLAGYRAALAGHGVAFQPRLVRVGPGRPEHAATTLRALLDGAEPPTAVLAGSAPIALGVQAAMAERELRHPRDLSLLGLEDADWMRAAAIGAVDTMPARIAETAVGLLFRRIGQPGEPPRREAIAADFDPRRSCAAS